MYMYIHVYIYIYIYNIHTDAKARYGVEHAASKRWAPLETRRTCLGNGMGMNIAAQLYRGTVLGALTPRHRRWRPRRPHPAP